MPDNSERNDPWAPPEARQSEPGIDLGKPAPPAAGPHNQPTVTSMPTAGFGAPAGDQLPPPPVAPGGPAQPAPGPYGYPAPTTPMAGGAGAPGVPGAPGGPGGAVGPGAGYGYPGYPAPYGANPWGPAPANGLGIAAMVLGIVSVVTFCLYGVVSIITGALGLILGIVARKRVKRGEANNGGMATAGIITGSIGIVLGILVLGGLIWAIAEGVSRQDDFDSYDDSYSTSMVVPETVR
ncbi:DUF4190 domain-containing protein [Streptomyces sp. TRM49041]|uniref:DUF4190 domain-containing protein n=1 Tax=Streptomyces sp. TRM49041 TaxID=2603216 RepID=UPI0011EE664D|nr:DUF4190 domain-containing protein [Streptomyces sp. TRM49041]